MKPTFAQPQRMATLSRTAVIRVVEMLRDAETSGSVKPQCGDEQTRGRQVWAGHDAATVQERWEVDAATQLDVRSPNRPHRGRTPRLCGILGTESEVPFVSHIALKAGSLYLSVKVPGTCRLRTRVTVKPGARRHLTLEAFRRWVMQAPSRSEMPLWRSERCLSDALPI